MRKESVEREERGRGGVMTVMGGCVRVVVMRVMGGYEIEEKLTWRFSEWRGCA